MHSASAHAYPAISMRTDDQVQKELDDAWRTEIGEAPDFRLVLPHLLLQRDHAVKDLPHPHMTAGRATEHAAQLVTKIGTWRESRSGVDLTHAWERVVLDAEPSHWMPRLAGLNPALPLSPDYARIGRAPSGAVAQMLLLLIAGEVGFRTIIMDWATAAVRMHVPLSELHAAAALLSEHGWIEREWISQEPSGEERGVTLLARIARSALVRPTAQ